MLKSKSFPTFTKRIPYETHKSRDNRAKGNIKNEIGVVSLVQTFNEINKNTKDKAGKPAFFILHFVKTLHKFSNN